MLSFRHIKRHTFHREKMVHKKSSTQWRGNKAYYEKSLSNKRAKQIFFREIRSLGTTEDCGLRNKKKTLSSMNKRMFYMVHVYIWLCARNKKNSWQRKNVYFPTYKQMAKQNVHILMTTQIERWNKKNEICIVCTKYLTQYKFCFP